MLILEHQYELPKVSRTFKATVYPTTQYLLDFGFNCTFSKTIFSQNKTKSKILNQNWWWCWIWLIYCGLHKITFLPLLNRKLLPLWHPLWPWCVPLWSWHIHKTCAYVLSTRCGQRWGCGLGWWGGGRPEWAWPRGNQEPRLEASQPLPAPWNDDSGPRATCSLRRTGPPSNDWK